MSASTPRPQSGPRINIASGDDVVAVQIGSVGEVVRSESGSEPEWNWATSSGLTINIRTGNARVGQQLDHIDVQHIEVDVIRPESKTTSAASKPDTPSARTS